VAKVITPTIWAILVYSRLEKEGNAAQIRLFRTIADQIQGVELSSKPKAILIQFVAILNLVSE
jgi:hypothetical protein